MSSPLASLTVKFTQPLTGVEIMAAVKAVANREDTRYIEEHYLDDGDLYRVGQASRYADQQIFVSPAQEALGIDPDATYDHVVVMSWSWPSVEINLEGFGNDAVQNAVRKFGKRLNRFIEEHLVSE